MSAPSEKYWQINSNQLLSDLNSSEKGLTEVQANACHSLYGENKISGDQSRKGIIIFISQFRNPLVWVLLGACLISFSLGDALDALVIVTILMLTATLGFYQEFKAEHALQELKKFISPRCRVFRDGNLTVRDVLEIVPGDVVQLNIGDIVPADIRLLASENFSCDESSLTGESIAAEKAAGELSAEVSLPPEITNCAFMGTAVASGNAKGVVFATGANTFFGKTAAYLGQAEAFTDFEKSLNQLGKFLLRIVLVMTTFIFIANAFLGKGYFESFVFAVALAVGITPEALPIIMTITLSRGAEFMAKKKVIIKRLSAVEDFGNMEILCSDKTGTLTLGVLTLEQFLTTDGKSDPEILLKGMVCSSADITASEKQFTNPIDQATWNNDHARQLLTTIAGYSVSDMNEFDFVRRRTSVLASSAQKAYMIIKGAPESMLSISSQVKLGNEVKPLCDDLLAQVKNQIKAFEEDGYRLILLGEKEIQDHSITLKDERNITLIGYLLYLDPAKKDARESLEQLEDLGVKVKIISGDSAVICRKICNEVGIEIIGNRIVTGDELAEIGEGDLREYSRKYNVFARVTPEQKYKIVSSLNAEYSDVGYLGDGINDAPALKAANIGITVDSGSAIAKEASDIILLEKNLGVLADGIELGRKTFGNITKYILNTISGNYGNMFTVAVSSLFLPFIPLLSSQILLNNFLSDLPLLSISTDNVDEEYLRKPKKWNLKLVGRFMLFFGLISSVFDFALILPLIFIFESAPPEFRTAWFTESACSAMLIIFAIRTRLPFYKSRPNLFLSAAILFTVLLTIVITYLPTTRQLFGFVPLSTSIYLYIATIIVTYFITVEFCKQIFYRVVSPE